MIIKNGNGIPYNEITSKYYIIVCIIIGTHVLALATQVHK